MWYREAAVQDREEHTHAGVEADWTCNDDGDDVAAEVRTCKRLEEAVLHDTMMKTRMRDDVLRVLQDDRILRMVELPCCCCCYY